MVSEGDSGSRRWSGPLWGTPGLSGIPCLSQSTSGTPSSGPRDIPDRACLPPSPAFAPHSGLSRPEVLGEALGRRKCLSYHPSRFLFQSWSLPPVTPVSQFSLCSPHPFKESPLLPVLLLPLASVPCFPRLPASPLS